MPLPGYPPLERSLCRATAPEPTLVDGLRELGWKVERVIAYRTVPARPRADVLERALSADAITFASGSTVRSFVEAVGAADRHPAVVVSIGPETTAAADRAGLEVTATADPHSLDGMVAALVAELGRARAAVTASASMSPAALVFDLDGTILDTETIEYDSVRLVWDEFGHHYPVSRFVDVIGTTDSPPWIAELELLLGEPVDAVRIGRRRHEFKRSLLAELRPRPGVVELIDDAVRPWHPARRRVQLSTRLGPAPPRRCRPPPPFRRTARRRRVERARSPIRRRTGRPAQRSAPTRPPRWRSRIRTPVSAPPWRRVASPSPVPAR